VDPPHLDTFATALDGLAGDAAAAMTYLHKHLSYNYGDSGMFPTIANANNDTKEAVSSSLERLKDVVTKSAEELRKASKMYVATDDKEERRLDATYPSK
jgi:hypothetical protein